MSFGSVNDIVSLFFSDPAVFQTNMKSYIHFSEIDPRLASPKPESYEVKQDEGTYGYKKIKYPIPASQVGEKGYKGTEVSTKKKKKQWRR